MTPQLRAALVAYRGITAAVAAAPAGVIGSRRRAVAIYLLVTGCNVPGAIAARVAGCTKQNVSKLMRSVENQRDVRAFDAALAALEAAIFEEEATDG